MEVRCARFVGHVEREMRVIILPIKLVRLNEVTQIEAKLISNLVEYKFWWEFLLLQLECGHYPTKVIICFRLYPLVKCLYPGAFRRLKDFNLWFDRF